jgi:hypothetical protein
MPERRSFLHKPDEVLSPEELDRRRAHLAAYVERNKVRKGRGEDPPAAMPALVEPRPKGPKLSGGAAVALTFEETT